MPAAEMGRRSGLTRWAWVPIPLLAVAIIATRWAGLRESYENDALRLVLSFTFYTLVSLGTLFLIGRSFLTSGSPGLLPLECGVVLWSLAGTVGDAVSHGDANINVTIFNTVILLAGLCHLAGAILSLRPQRALRATPLWLAAGCALALGALGLVTWAALGHWLPVFFIPGQGGTLVRYCVLLSAIATFVLSAVLLLAGRRAARAPFSTWYALALLLLAVGLFGIMIQLSFWSVVNWLGRTAQWLGGLYLLFAALAALRESNQPLLPLAEKLRPAPYRDAMAVVLVLGAAAVRLALLPMLGMRAPFTTFYPAVMLAALYGGFRAGLLATLLSGVLANYFWMEPVGRFAINDLVDGVSLAIFFLSGLIISWITDGTRRAQARTAQAEAEASVAVERAQAAESLRESERLQGLLARIGERAAQCTQSAELIEAIGECVAGHLGVSRCGISRVNMAAGEVTVVADYYSHLPSLAGVYRTQAYAAYQDDMQAGRTVFLEDSATDPRTAAVYERAFAPLQVRAQVVVPLHRDGQWVGNFWVSHHEPRRWAAADAQLLRLVAERVWVIMERQRAEEALAEAEERLRSVLENMSEGIMLFDPQGNCIYQNAASLRIHGYTSAEEGRFQREELPAVYKGWDKTGRPLSFEEWPIARVCRQERFQDQVLRALRVDTGHEWFASYNGCPIFGVDGKLRLGFITIRDITDQVRAEEQMRTLTQRLTYHVDNSPLAVIEWGPDMRLVRWSGAAERLFGWKAEEVLGKRMEDLRWIYHEDEPQVAEVSGDLQSGAKPRRFSANRNYRKDGSVVHCEWYNSSLVDASGKLLSILSLVLDVTERKQAEEALRESERRERERAEELAVLFEAVPIPVFIARDPDCLHLTGNRLADEILRIPHGNELSMTGPAETKPHHFRTFKDGRELRLDELPAQRAARGAHVRDFEFTLVFGDGMVRQVLGYGTPLMDAQGHPRGTVAVMVDITERKRAEESIATSLREKEVLLKEIHHRVKNNLQVISSLVDLQTNSLDDPVLRGLFQDVRNRVRSMALVHEKLYQSENLAGVDFADYTRSLIKFLSRAHGRAETTVSLKLDLKPVSLPVETAVPCGLILNELVTNAFKHAFRGRSRGEVTIALGTGPDGRVALRVGDDGVGLPAGTDWRKSSSLGLQLIHLLSGQLDATVEVSTGIGTNFLISFEQPQRAPVGEQTHA